MNDVREMCLHRNTGSNLDQCPGKNLGGVQVVHEPMIRLEILTLTTLISQRRDIVRF